MNYKNILLFTIASFVVSYSAFSQSIEIPRNVSLKKYSDFRKMESKTIKIIDWLMSDKSFNNKEKRAEAELFVDKFVEAHPYISYSPTKSLVKFKRNSEYARQFKLGWIRFVLSYEYSKNKLLNHQNGFNHVTKFYSNYKNKFGRSSYTEKINKLEQSKKLKEFIKNKI